MKFFFKKKIYYNKNYKIIININYLFIIKLYITLFNFLKIKFFFSNIFFNSIKNLSFKYIYLFLINV